MRRRIFHVTLFFVLGLALGACADCGGCNGEIAEDAGDAGVDDRASAVPDAVSLDTGAVDTSTDVVAVDSGIHDLGRDDLGQPDRGVVGDSGQHNDLGSVDSGQVDDSGSVDDRGQNDGGQGADVWLDPTQSTSLFDSTRFLYEGSDAPQQDVAPDAIEAKRLAIVRGLVLLADGGGAAGVQVSVHDHPELGWTSTDENGSYSMAVNGGGLLTLRYHADGFLPVDRQVHVPWDSYAHADTAVLTALDSAVTQVDLDGMSTPTVARATTQTDDDGTRQATLIFRPGTQASMVFADGSRSPLTSLSVRATEYTVGADGPQAMPAPLPSTSAYTYCVELSVDEALAAGASEVEFTEPVVFYVENFLDFPVGSIVPVGTYDRRDAAWVASQDGKVIEVLEVVAELAQLDLDGDGVAEEQSELAELGVDEEEQRTLANLYPDGAGLWRVQIPHFSPWDCNWPYGLPAGAWSPDDPPVPTAHRPNSCEVPGSIIECQNQVLGERIFAPGLPYSLNYRTDRVPGGSVRSIEIPLIGDEVPNDIAAVRVTVEVAGQQHKLNFPPVSDSVHHFRWDGKDAFGRQVQGSVNAKVTVAYIYRAFYYANDTSAWAQSFAQVSSGTSTVAIAARLAIALERTWAVPLNVLDARWLGIGGWTLGTHHFFEPSKQGVYLGSGDRLQAAPGMGDVFSTVYDFGPNHRFESFAIDERGDLYFVDNENQHQIKRRDPEGNIHHEVGSSCQIDYRLDGQVAASASACYPRSIAFGPSGQLYWAELQRIRTRLADGTVKTIAGRDHPETITPELIGDGGPAVDALLGNVVSLAVGNDGSIYYTGGAHCTDCPVSVVRRIGTDGIVEIFAGNGQRGSNGEGPARSVSLNYPTDVVVGPDSSVFILDTDTASAATSIIKRVGVDGVLSRYAGRQELSTGQPLGDRGLATDAYLQSVKSLTVGPDGALYFLAHHRLDWINVVAYIGMVSPDGILYVIGGDGEPERPTEYVPQEGAAAVGQYFYFASNSAYIALAPDGSLLFTETDFGNSSNSYLRSLHSANPTLRFGEVLVPGPSGGEVFVFASGGRHLRTLHGGTGEVLREFNYSDQGHLVAIQEQNGLLTEIERDALGLPTALIGPRGARSELEVNSDGYLSTLEDAAGRRTEVGYRDGEGLVTSFSRPGAAASSYAYDGEQGSLLSATDPLGETQTLERFEYEDGIEVVHTTRAGRQRRFWVATDTLRDRTLTRGPDGLETERIREPDGTEYTLRPDGTQTVLRVGPDPRFGMGVPIMAEAVLETPSGLISTIVTDRAVVLSDPNDPNSVVTQTNTVDHNGVLFTSVYDAAAGTVTSLSPEGRQSVRQTDTSGRLLGVMEPGRPPFALEWSAVGTTLDAITSGATGEQRRVEYSYDQEERLTLVTLSNGQTISIGGYDAADRATTIQVPGARDIALAYDQRDNLTSITVPGGETHEFTWNALDQIQRYTPPDASTLGGEFVYSYDADGLLAQRLRSDGASVTVEHDASSRIDWIQFSHGRIEYHHDSQTGHLAEITAADGVGLSYTRDGPMLTSMTWSGPINGVVERTYNQDLRVDSLTVAGAAVDRTYDQDGFITSTGVATIEREPSSGRVNGVHVLAVETAVTWNSWSELSTMDATFGTTTLFHEAFAYDDLGRVIRRDETVGGATTVWTYHYSASGFLETVLKDGLQDAQYAYDANGNRISVDDDNGARQASFNTQDAIEAQGTIAFVHDAGGARSSRTEGAQITSYVYDSFGHLRQVALPSGQQITYLVDGRQRRVGKLVDGALVQGLLYKDWLRPVAELDADGDLRSHFVYALDHFVPDYMVQGGVTYAFVADHLGSVRLVVDTRDGSVVQRLDYDAFGRVIADSNPGFQPFGFAGGLYDPDTGLVRFGLRDYDPETGRFTSKDPIRFDGGNTNLYAYVHNNPVSYVDVTGLAPALCDALRGVCDYEMEQGVNTFKSPWGDFSNFPHFDDAFVPSGDEPVGLDGKEVDIQYVAMGYKAGQGRHLSNRAGATVAAAASYYYWVLNVQLPVDTFVPDKGKHHGLTDPVHFWETRGPTSSNFRGYALGFFAAMLFNSFCDFYRSFCDDPCYGL